MLAHERPAHLIIYYIHQLSARASLTAEGNSDQNSGKSILQLRLTTDDKASRQNSGCGYRSKSAGHHADQSSATVTKSLDIQARRRR